MVRLGLASAGIAFGIVGACTFPDPNVDPASGDGGAPSSTSTSIVGSSSGAQPSSTGSTGSSSTTTTTTTDVGGGSSSSSGADGGGGSSSSSDGGGGSDTGGGGEGVGAGTSVVTGVGGGVTDIVCDNGCIPFPQGTGGAGGTGGGAGGTDDDCDDDTFPNEEDCQPCDPEVFPYEEGDDNAYHDVGYQIFGAEEGQLSFDYDCNGIAKFEYGYSPTGCQALPETTAGCNNMTLYSGGDNPVCGDAHFVQDCKLTASLLEANCSNDGVGSNMLVRCR